MISQDCAQTQAPAMVPYAQYAYERERRIKAEQLLEWERKLWRNRNLNPAHKLALVAMREGIERGTTKDEQGRTRINLTTQAKQIGMSPDTLSRCLKAFTERLPGLLDVQEQTEVQENGERWTRKYVKFEDEQRLANPDQLTPITPRKHGGKRYTCPKCLGEDVQIKHRVTLVCACGHESLIEETVINQGPREENDGDTTPGRNLQDILKPVTPQGGGTLPDAEVSADLLTIAALYADIAGPSAEHIEMSRHGEKKYYTVPRPLSSDDVLEHIRGGKARGALCNYDDGRTRSLCWDSDDDSGWVILQQAGRQLVDAGYLPLLEESPAGRGGHLWVVYDELVDAGVARERAYSVAPELAAWREYWPGPQDARRWNKVRLPGGRYVWREVDAWCRVVSVADGEMSYDGESAGRLVLSHQTASSTVMSSRNDVEEQLAFYVVEGVLAQEDESVVTMQDGPPVDERWHEKYNGEQGRRLWFRWTAQYLAAWWDEKHSVDELLPSERNGLGLASWRGERTASVAKRGDQWTDFGIGARGDDGTQDGGDALELQARLNGETGGHKSETMCQAARELLDEARHALEDAAKRGEELSGWIQEIVTGAGLDHYERVAADSGYYVDVAKIRARLAGGIEGEASCEVIADVTRLVLPVDEASQGMVEMSLLITREDERSMDEDHESEKHEAASRAAMAEINKLDALKAYGEATGWVALVSEGKEIIPAGRSAWLEFLWLSHKKKEQHRVYEALKQSGQLPGEQGTENTR